MKNGKKVAWILVSVCFLSMIALVIIYVNSSPPVEGWKDFKKNSIRNYSFVDDVNLDRITPVDFRISYTLNRKITQEEVDSVFSWTTKYIQSEKVFSDLKKYHAKRYRYSFARLAIVFTYRDNNEHFECNIFSSPVSNGEPNYADYKTWYIEYNGKSSEVYNPMLK
ncbi:MAG TPA: hypothetical protein DEF39_13905 [Hungateiclostridium thermocellum]|uniref:Uncharacterized protein n=1 Tax=Acetivibrio thermocellus (strain ATCC 27405 / DSM 1237 / JCM 9322 / NBRC 103400 / NCIMB 10682 / NRRL B-4536 / VPI 7372) TaxID=203119 RepID=A3DKD9_ACET2|nr:hypothetical protein [Acetivibrio thermocellus]CDG37702.1 hypothetical protein CTHBC1_3145 [Acetivibrio thermocellus BC1]ABN54418.1 hypothetical protein Cthe_3223 [Acetivibrio thermocellus ATCC 27405]NLU27236.1 hypothetical protein [Acetivibrio thermocellus]THJ76530.1 hypothetical protein EPD62_16125 [Acetivibrio thermocellus]HBW28323.1 hypothetical protein [Acetivibrio thermocellus]